jgi:surfeit locus 1 family protein
MSRLAFPVLIGLGGLAILIYLGTWQVQRLGWKQDLIARIEAKISDTPIPLSQALEAERYTPVTLTGQFADGYLRALASRKTLGPVYRILRPFQTTDAGTIIVDTGWIKDGTAVLPVPTGQLTLIGNLDAPNEIDSFTPDPDTTANIWYARDVPAMAETLGTDPIMVVLRDRADPHLGVTPWPVDTRAIPNDHLQYAITWFSLALVWIGMTLYFMRRSTRAPQK